MQKHYLLHRDLDALRRHLVQQVNALALSSGSQPAAHPQSSSQPYFLPVEGMSFDGEYAASG
jgi:hypothetical protein